MSIGGDRPPLEPALPRSEADLVLFHATSRAYLSEESFVNSLCE